MGKKEEKLKQLKKIIECNNNTISSGVNTTPPKTKIKDFLANNFVEIDGQYYGRGNALYYKECKRQLFDTFGDYITQKSQEFSQYMLGNSYNITLNSLLLNISSGITINYFDWFNPESNDYSKLWTDYLADNNLMPANNFVNLLDFYIFCVFRRGKNQSYENFMNYNYADIQHFINENIYKNIKLQKILDLSEFYFIDKIKFRKNNHFKENINVNIIEIAFNKVCRQLYEYVSSMPDETTNIPKIEFTPRQTDIIRGVLENLSSKDIAEKYCLTEDSVTSYITNIAREIKNNGYEVNKPQRALIRDYFSKIHQ